MPHGADREADTAADSGADSASALYDSSLFGSAWSPREGAERVEAAGDDFGETGEVAFDFGACNPGDLRLNAAGEDAFASEWAECGRRSRARRREGAFVYRRGRVRYDVPRVPPGAVFAAGGQGAELTFAPPRASLSAGFGARAPGSNCVAAGRDVSAADDSSQAFGFGNAVRVSGSAAIAPVSAGAVAGRAPVGGSLVAGVGNEALDCLGVAAVGSGDCAFANAQLAAAVASRRAAVGDAAATPASDACPCVAVVASEGVAVAASRDCAVVGCAGVELVGCAGVVVAGVEGPLRLEGRSGLLFADAVECRRATAGELRAEAAEVRDLRVTGAFSAPARVQTVDARARPAPRKPPVAPSCQLGDLDNFRPVPLAEDVISLYVRRETSLVFVAAEYQVAVFLPAFGQGAVGEGRRVAVKDVRAGATRAHAVRIYPALGDAIETGKTGGPQYGPPRTLVCAPGVERPFFEINTNGGAVEFAYVRTQGAGLWAVLSVFGGRPRTIPRD